MRDHFASNTHHLSCSVTCHNVLDSSFHIVHYLFPTKKLGFVYYWIICLLLYIFFPVFVFLQGEESEGKRREWEGLRGRGRASARTQLQVRIGPKEEGRRERDRMEKGLRPRGRPPAFARTRLRVRTWPRKEGRRGGERGKICDDIGARVDDLCPCGRAYIHYVFQMHCIQKIN